jgi:indolepyruvate ferredoxin oxidoreductase
VLNPSGVQEYLDLGVHGWAMSRYSGCWVGLKCVTDTVESTSRVEVDPDRVAVRIPDDFEMPPGGLSIRWPDPPLAQELRMLHQKAYAALAYARANRLNRIVLDSPNARLGIITCGKSYLDVRQALDELGIDAVLAAEIGLRLYKVGMSWPLEPEAICRFAEGPRGDPRRRGEAPASRVPAQGGALQLARRRQAAGDRQVRREGRVGAAAGGMAAARGLGADAGYDRPRHR